MFYKTTCAISFNGSRVEKGAQVETTPAEAARYGSDLVPVADQVEVADVKGAGPVALEDMSHDQLKDRAKELNLKASGSKADIQERITLFLDTMEQREVTEADLEANPALVEAEVKVGDVIYLPKAEVKN